MKYPVIIMSALAILCSGCFEKTAPGDVPSSFFYKGQPVDPLCFLDNGAQVGDDTISLSVCSGKNKTPPSYKEDHFYGVEIDDMSGSMTQPYIYYRYIGRTGDQHVIQIVASTGGTGQFSGVRAVTLDGDLLHTVRRIAVGDRCNGGVASASVDGDVVSYSQNITPMDLVTLSDGNQAGFVAYDDIDSSAASCAGTANYEGTTLKGVTLTMDPKTEPTDDVNPKNACFYAVYNDTYKDDTELDGDELKAFGQAFNTRCGPLKGQ